MKLGTVYLLHFHSPLHHARHYIGWTEGDVESRIETHRRGNGAKLLAAVSQKGIEWELVRIWEGKDRNFERYLKRRKAANSLCPVCREKYNEYHAMKMRRKRKDYGAAEHA